MRDRLRSFFCDHLSIMRGKVLPEEKIGSGYTRFAQPNFAVHYDKDLIIDAPGTECMNGLPDMELRWQARDIRQGWEPHTRVVVGDLFDRHGEPVAVAGRHALRRAVADWQRHGLTPMVGLELECYAFTRADDGNLKPYDTPGGAVYGTGPFADPAGFMDAIWEAAETAGFRLALMTTEYDAPQFEFTLWHDEALRAVDDLVLFRLMAREIAIRRGVLLTFMPKPVAETGGSGLHVNLSFTDGTGNNALADSPDSGAETMNALAAGCVSGWMRHHKGLAGLIAPTVNSYARLQPASMSGYWCNWAVDHRGVTVRAAGEPGAKARLEHRMADASANPYTAVAAVLQAARLGYEGRYDLPAPETGDCFTGQDASEGTAGSLAEALDDLQTDTALCAAVGEALCAHHIHMKRVEIEKTAEMTPEALRDFYIWFV